MVQFPVPASRHFYRALRARGPQDATRLQSGNLAKCRRRMHMTLSLDVCCAWPHQNAYVTSFCASNAQLLPDIIDDSAFLSLTRFQTTLELLFSSLKGLYCRCPAMSSFLCCKGLLMSIHRVVGCAISIVHPGTWLPLWTVPIAHEHTLKLRSERVFQI